MKKLLIVSRSTVFQNKSGGLETQLEGLINYLKKSFDITVLTTALPFKNTPAKIDQVRVENSVKYIYLKDTIPGGYGYSLFESLLWQLPVKRNKNALNTNFKKRSADYFFKKLKGRFNLIISQSSSAQNFNITDEDLIAINHGTTLNEIKSRYKSINSFKDFLRFIGLNIPTLLYEYFINNPRFFKKCSKIVLISNSVKKDFCLQHKRFCSKTCVIDNGINTLNFCPDKSKYIAKVFKVFYVGRIDFEKGLKDFVLVAEHLKNTKDIKFNIYGNGPDSKYLRDLIDTKDLPNIKYHGAVSNDKISKIMNTSHVFLFLTKRKEGLPMSVIESMSSGCVVISGWNNQYKNFYEGFNSVDSAAKEILRLYNDRKSYKLLSNKFRQKAEENYSIEISGNKYLKLISALENKEIK